jgi:HK97 family phage prohead protease
MTLPIGNKSHRAMPFVSFKDISSADAPGTIEAIVSVFNYKDFANEIVMPGAFTNSLMRKLPRMVWGHDWLTPVGKTLEAIEMMPGDPRLPQELSGYGGLYVKGQFNLNTTRGKDAYEDMKFGAVDEFSIGYKIVNAHRVTQEGEDAELDPFDLLFGFGFGGKSTLYLDELDLIEWSPVLAGMNDRTVMVGVKQDGPIIDLVEQAARATGILFAKVAEYAETRKKEGRTFSSANYAKLEGFAGRLDEMASELRGLLGSSVPKSAESESVPVEEGATEPSLLQVVDTTKVASVIADLQEARLRINKIFSGI